MSIAEFARTCKAVKRDRMFTCVKCLQVWDADTGKWPTECKAGIEVTYADPAATARIREEYLAEQSEKSPLIGGAQRKASAIVSNAAMVLFYVLAWFGATVLMGAVLRALYEVGKLGWRGFGLWQ